MNPSFIAVIEDGNVIEMNSLEGLENYPTASYFFKKEIHSSQTSMFPPRDTYHSYYYTPIDKLGNKIVIKIGSLRLTDIGPDKINYASFHNRPIRFYDEELRAVREIFSKNKNINFLFKEIKVSIDILKAVNDWNLFLKIRDYDILKSEIEILKAEKFQLETKLRDCEERTSNDL